MFDITNVRRGVYIMSLGTFASLRFGTLSMRSATVEKLVKHRLPTAEVLVDRMDRFDTSSVFHNVIATLRDGKRITVRVNALLLGRNSVKRSSDDRESEGIVDMLISDLRRAGLYVFPPKAIKAVSKK